MYITRGKYRRIPMIYLAVTVLVIVPVNSMRSCTDVSTSFTEYVVCAKARVAPEKLKKLETRNFSKLNLSVK